MSDVSTIVPVTFQPSSTTKKTGIIKLGKEKQEAPNGRYTARCVHVEPNWTYLKNRKLALYFEIDEGEHAGCVARRFYNLKRLHDNTYEIPPKSKLFDDIKRLFPNELNNGEVDPETLFSGVFFIIEVERKGKHAIVKSMSHFETGF